MLKEDILNSKAVSMDSYHHHYFQNYFKNNPPEPMFSMGKAIPLDLSKSSVLLPESAFAIGGYLEVRPDTYTQTRYQTQKSFVHLGVDVVAPAKTKIYAPCSLRFFDRNYLAEDGDYGYCLLGELVWEGPRLFILLGHLAKSAFDLVSFNKIYKPGEEIAQMGAFHENGGWVPHLHLQLSFLRPLICDMKGTCSIDELESYSLLHPDPSLLLQSHL
jgi:hypothetical protein